MAGKIITFGHHDREAPRHWNIVKTLQEQGYEVVDCHTMRKGFGPKVRDLLMQWNENKSDAEALLVTFPGHYLMPVAWLITRRPRRKLIFDAFVSMHDSIVTDRRLVSPWNPYAWFLYWMDFLSCHLADEILIDTEAHRQFFIGRFHLDPKRIRVVYLGSRTDLFTPLTEERKNEKRKTSHPFEVFFYGTYIPLQGIEHILDAAKIVQEKNPNVHFTLVGGGQMFKTMQGKANAIHVKNVTFLPFAPLMELPLMIQHADLCLGIFGTTGKTRRVIPHKVYDAVSCGVPILTADTPAIREKFGDHPLVILCPPGNPEAIADCILTKTRL